jgi:chemotaxis protein MotA
MALSTFLGMLFGFGLFFGSIIMSTNNYMSFVSVSSFLMVFGGTLAASFISFQGRYVVLALKGVGNMFKKPVATRETINHDIMHLVKWGYVVQSKGLIALESEVNASSIKHPVLKHGAELVASAYKPEEVREMLEINVETTHERDMIAAEILKNMAQTAPAFGMIGTLVGLIIMLQSLGDDLSALGMGLSVALLTTLYGVVFSRLIFLPAALKYEQRVDIERFRNLVVAEGLALLAEKQSPRYMQDRLNSFLSPDTHFSIDNQ